MTLIEQIENDQVSARKKGSKEALFLTTLIGEIRMVGKNKRNGDPTDEESLEVIKKFAKNIRETLTDARVNLSQEKFDALSFEHSVYERYMPSQLSLEDLKGVINEIVNSVREDNSGELTMRDMKTVIGKLSERHPDMYDGKSASILIRELITRK